MCCAASKVPPGQGEAPPWGLAVSIANQTGAHLAVVVGNTTNFAEWLWHNSATAGERGVPSSVHFFDDPMPTQALNHHQLHGNGRMILCVCAAVCAVCLCGDATWRG